MEASNINPLASSSLLCCNAMNHIFLLHLRASRFFLQIVQNCLRGENNLIVFPFYAAFGIAGHDWFFLTYNFFKSSQCKMSVTYIDTRWLYVT